MDRGSHYRLLSRWQDLELCNPDRLLLELGSCKFCFSSTCHPCMTYHRNSTQSILCNLHHDLYVKTYVEYEFAVGKKKSVILTGENFDRLNLISLIRFIF